MLWQGARWHIDCRITHSLGRGHRSIQAEGDMRKTSERNTVKTSCEFSSKCQKFSCTAKIFILQQSVTWRWFEFAVRVMGPLCFSQLEASQRVPSRFHTCTATIKCSGNQEEAYVSIPKSQTTGLDFTFVTTSKVSLSPHVNKPGHWVHRKQVRELIVLTIMHKV